MPSARRIIVVHHAPTVVEIVALVLSASGFTVHPAATFGRAIRLLKNFDSTLVAVIAHADMPTEPFPGTFLASVEVSHPEAALVVMSGRSREQIGRLPRRAMLLREPFDRVQLLEAILTAVDARVAARAKHLPPVNQLAL